MELAPREEGGSMLNAIERATIAKYVADYLIEHLLIEEPMESEELGRLARVITEDRISDPAEFDLITNLAVGIVSKDPRIVVRTNHEKALWVYHKECPPAS